MFLFSTYRGRMTWADGRNFIGLFNDGSFEWVLNLVELLRLSRFLFLFKDATIMSQCNYFIPILAYLILLFMSSNAPFIIHLQNKCSL